MNEQSPSTALGREAPGEARRTAPERLAAVRATGLLDTEIEEAFDRLTRLAVRLVGISAAFISLVDEHRDFYKSTCGFGEPLATSRELEGPTFCHFTIQSDQPLVIPDTRADARYRNVPTVHTLGVAAYVGIPLVVGHQVIGAFCAIEMTPRAWSDRDVATLTDLAAIAVSEIELRSAQRGSDLAREESEALNRVLAHQATELESRTEALNATTKALLVTTGELHDRTIAAEQAREIAVRAADELATSEARYRVLTEAVPVQVWTATPDGRLDYASARASAFFGVPAEDVLGTGWTAFVHPDDLPAAAARWSDALATGQPYEVEFRLRNGHTGEYRWHLVRALPHRTDDGTISGWTGSNTDVEGERRARAEAEAANQSKSEFLAVMSHELRTPLNAIGGYAELIETEIRGPVTAEQRHDLERIQRSQRHLLGLINGILNYAKIDAGKMDFAIEDVPMDEVLATCTSLTAPQAAQKRIEIRYPEKKTGLVGRADRDKVQQVMLNLLSNAIKFTEPGGRVSVSCTAHDDRVAVAVTDTGVGIAPEQLERAFQPFVQIDAGRARDHAGTGLGLAISRDLARGMSGDVSATSELGVGSTFLLTLPLKSDA